LKDHPAKRDGFFILCLSVSRKERKGAKNAKFAAMPSSPLSSVRRVKEFDTPLLLSCRNKSFAVLA